MGSPYRSTGNLISACVGRGVLIASWTCACLVSGIARGSARQRLPFR
jgi:hypothetical protein